MSTEPGDGAPGGSAPPAGPAIAVASTGRALGRSKRVVAAVLVVAVGILVVAAAMWNDDRSVAGLQRSGERADATVTAVAVTVGSRGRLPTGSVSVAFTAAGRDRARTVFVGSDVTKFHEGQATTVVFDPDVAHVELLGTDAGRAGIPTALVGGAGLLVGFVALHLGRRVRRLRRLLTAQPWVPATSRLTDVQVQLARRRGVATLLWLAASDGRSVLAQPVGFDRLALTFEPTVWTVHLGEQRFVVAPPGGAPIRWMRVVR